MGNMTKSKKTTNGNNGEVKKRKSIPFDTKKYCAEAIRICNNYVENEMDYSLDSLKVMEAVIQNFRRLNREGIQDDSTLWAISCFFGTYAGEVYLRDKLSDMGYKWVQDEKDGIPVISNGTNSISPFTKIYKKFEDKTDGNDTEGTLLGCYNAFLALLKEMVYKEVIDDDLSGSYEYFEIKDNDDFKKIEKKIIKNHKQKNKKINT